MISFHEMSSQPSGSPVALPSKRAWRVAPLSRGMQVADPSSCRSNPGESGAKYFFPSAWRVAARPASCWKLWLLFQGSWLDQYGLSASKYGATVAFHWFHW